MPGFKNVSRYDNDGISNLLEINLKYFLEDGFLRIGGIIPPRTSILQPDTSKDTTNLRVWNSKIQGWAYKRINPDGSVTTTPASVSVNGVGEFGANINYSRGQVTFNRELRSTDRVEATHFTNRLSIFTVLELNRRPMIQLGSETGRATHDDYTVFQELAVNEKISTPYIIIEAFPTGSSKPYMIGTGAVNTTNRIQLNVVTETVGELSRILDILRVQSYKTTAMFDTNRAAIDRVLPIDPITGDINPSGIQYPDLTNRYYLDSMYWKTVSVRRFKTIKEDIHMGIAYFTVDILSNPRI